MAINLSHGLAHTYRDGANGLTIFRITDKLFLIVRHEDGAAVEVSNHHAAELLQMLEQAHHAAKNGAWNGGAPNPVVANASAYRVINEVFVEPVVAEPTAITDPARAG